MKSNILVLFLFFVLLTGCSSKLPPDVIPAKDLPSLQEKVVYMKISGSLVDADGVPVQGVQVSSETQHGKWTDTTTYTGAFRIEAIVSEGDTIDFRFKPEKKNLQGRIHEWNVPIYDYDLPKGIERIKFNFVVERNGSIRLMSKEY